jgi:pimeloyl-ACP methyl ester carboxylesterase
LLIGDQEAIYDPESAVRRARELIPDIEAEIVPNSSHGLPMEQPGLINERVLRFLSKEID